VGVREPVLVKANKLYDRDLCLLLARFAFIKKSLESDALRRKLSMAVTLAPGCAEDLAVVDEEFQRQLGEVEEARRFALSANQPTALPPGGFERIQEIAGKTYVDGDGLRQPFLTTREVESLTIARGSLTVQERQEIESHVTHSFRFLRQIPWTTDLRRIPALAYAHHEKLDGTGYPSGLHGDEIPLQSKMMMISDIYDALTAADRPYKPAISPERALEILAQEAGRGYLDPELVRVFTEGTVWSLTGKQAPQA
jgi:hypothetical protein